MLLIKPKDPNNQACSWISRIRKTCLIYINQLVPHEGTHNNRETSSQVYEYLFRYYCP